MRRVRAKGFGPFRGNDGLTPRERRGYRRQFQRSLDLRPVAGPERDAMRERLLRELGTRPRHPNLDGAEAVRRSREENA